MNVEPSYCKLSRVNFLVSLRVLESRVWESTTTSECMTGDARPGTCRHYICHMISRSQARGHQSSPDSMILEF